VRSSARQRVDQGWPQLASADPKSTEYRRRALRSGGASDTVEKQHETTRRMIDHTLHLIAGGVGYPLSAFVRYLVPGSEGVVDALALPATVGEVWMIGYLLVRGVGGRARKETPTPVGTPAAV
jgi:uncharacterized protein DUF4386